MNVSDELLDQLDRFYFMDVSPRERGVMIALFLTEHLHGRQVSTRELAHEFACSELDIQIVLMCLRHRGCLVPIVRDRVACYDLRPERAPQLREPLYKTREHRWREVR